jgi:hypothetical protein
MQAISFLPYLNRTVVNFIYSIPYLLFLVYLIIFSFYEFYEINKQQSTNDVRFFVILGFLFFFGLRGFISTDWIGYYSNFEELGTIWDSGLLKSIKNQKTEKGFWLYAALIKSIYPNYFFWVFISSLIDVIILNIVFKRYVRYYCLAFVIFFTFYGMLMEINLMRNIKSVLLFLLSIRYLQKRHIIPYMLLNGLGIFFHISSIIYLPLYFFLTHEFPKILFWIIFIISNIIVLFNIKFIQPIFIFFGNIIGGRIPSMVDAYFSLETLNAPAEISFGYLEKIFSYLFFAILFYQKFKNLNKNNIIFINMYILYFICSLCFFEIQTIRERISGLFVPAYWVLYPNLLILIQKRSNKQLFLISTIAFIILYTGRYQNIMFHYDNLIFGIQSYEERRQIFLRFYNRKTI